MNTIVGMIIALLIIGIVTKFIGVFSSLSNRPPIDPEIIKALQPRRAARPISQHDLNIKKSIAYHLDNNQPFPGLDDMPAFLEGAEIADWKVKRNRLGESDYQGDVYWDGQ